MKNLEYCFPQNEDQLRECWGFYKNKLIFLFERMNFSIDFIRQLVENRTLEQKIELERAIYEMLCQIRLKQKETYCQIFVAYDTIICNKNIINYIKYCKVQNKELEDMLPIIEQYVEFRQKFGLDYVQKSPVVNKLIGPMGTIIDQVVF